ncbi:hypothetical protein BAE44_0015102, partial [Dichanthelium oligosanthes]
LCLATSSSTGIMRAAMQGSWQITSTPIPCTLITTSAVGTDPLLLFCICS